MTEDYSSQICAGAGVEIDAWHAQGRMLLDRGRRDEAEALYRRILAVNSQDAVAWCYLGTIRESGGLWQVAEAAYRSATAADPHLPHSHSNLGGLLNRLGRHREAEIACRRAISLSPELVEGHNNLGVALKELNRLAEAEQVFKTVLAMRPNLPQAEANLAAVLRAESRIEEAGRHARRAIALGWDHPGLFSDWLSSQQYVGGTHRARLAAMHTEWDRRYAAALQPIWRLSETSPEPDRRLRLGFVSPDFRRHPVAYYIVCVLENLDPQECEVVCFSDVRREDGMTDRLKRLAGEWKIVSSLPDESLAQEIAASRIDVLFDLAGHTGGNRLLAFARKPAPLQITWIGYPGTTGLRAMDYILADRHVIRAGEEADYREAVLRMPHVYSCYAPADESLEAAQPPLLKNGRVTFGSFNNPAKIGPKVIDVWK